MDFELSDDQLALQNAARDLLDGYASPAQVRAHIQAGHSYDAKLWTAMADQGWMGVTVPEAQGGLGLGWVEATILLEEIGRHVAPAPFLQTLLALEALTAAGNQESWIELLLAGEAVGCVSWGAGPVIYADAADVFVITEADRVTVAELPDHPAREPAMDLTRSLAWMPAATREAATPLGDATLATAVLDRGAVGHAAELLGLASRVLEMSAAYAKDRVQFGQPIGSFQAVKHRCADMVVDVEGMRSATWWAAWCLAAGDAEQSVAASTAKTWCSDAARRVMASGLQVHGGIGFTWEHDLHLYLKRAQLDQVSFGDAAWHRERLAGMLRARVEAGTSVI